MPTHDILPSAVGDFCRFNSGKSIFVLIANRVVHLIKKVLTVLAASTKHGFWLKNNKLVISLCHTYSIHVPPLSACICYSVTVHRKSILSYM